MRRNGTEPKEDKRPDPKPRKNPHLWQAYLFWSELVEMRKVHTLRISSIEKGKSNLVAEIEYDFLRNFNKYGGIDVSIKDFKKQMYEYGELACPALWNWMKTIRGLGEGSLNAQLIAQIDDIGKFSNISKLWRFSGLAVIDGKAEHCKKGEVSPYNRRLKSICYLIADQFIKQQTPLYVDIYYQEKKRLRELYPEKIKTETGAWKYNDGHLHHMAMRKAEKIFLQHVWLIWRKAEGLPITMPYAIDILGHADYIEPYSM